MMHTPLHIRQAGSSYAATLPSGWVGGSRLSHNSPVCMYVCMYFAGYFRHDCDFGTLFAEDTTQMSSLALHR